MKSEIKIMIADRNSNVLKLLTRELEAEGYRVESAANGAELTILMDRDECWDLLLIDPDLPLGDGMEILEKLEKRLPPVPIIIHSSNNEYVNHPRLGFVKAFIEKGEDLDRLKLKIAQVMEGGFNRPGSSLAKRVRESAILNGNGKTYGHG